VSDYPPLIIEREFKAPIERVFQAWTEPDLLMKWFRSSPNVAVDSAEVDLRVGGAYRIAVSDPDDVYVVFGKYTQVVVPELIEFTWKWEESTMEPVELLVRVELSSAAAGTRMRLTHSQFSNEKSANAHDHGWNGVLATLAIYLEDSQSTRRI